ncbi:MAG: Sensor histidine kinase [Acidobacteriales bacterium]|nr:Sensor histidine kinase [Terriglobales bacterium]
MRQYLKKEFQEINQGDHVCFVYRTLAEQLFGIATWVLQGLERNEQCFCIQTPQTSTALLELLGKWGFDVDKEIRCGAVVIGDMKKTYLANGTFDPVLMAALLAKASSLAKVNGFRGFRVTGDMSWALRHEPASDGLILYERAMEKFFSENKSLGMCQYHARHFPAPTLQNAMRAHGTTLLEDEASPNRCRLRLRRENLFADILKGPRVRYRYVVKQDDSPDVLASGEAADLSTARKQAKAALLERAA